MFAYLSFRGQVQHFRWWDRDHREHRTSDPASSLIDRLAFLLNCFACFMGIHLKLIDNLLAAHGHRSEDIVGGNGLLKQLTKAVLERALQAEMTGHLGYDKHDPVRHKSGNSRNGKTAKR